MRAISRKTIVKSAVTTLASVLASVSIVLLVVPLLGGHPDGPGFWMSVFCPLVIAGPASLWQFHQTDVIERQRDELAHMHVALEDMHIELRRLHDDLRWRARRDALTGGLNREALFAALDDLAGRDPGPVALLIADADHFKRINDTFGHLVGDEALRRIAATIDATLGPDDLWGRIGGEEFVIFLAKADPEQARRIAGSIRRAVADVELQADGRRVPLSVSIGAASTTGVFDPIDLFRQADQHLYGAKDGGRNRVVIDGREIDPVTA
ncbi:GGDEF domain-containing protein [Rhizobium sp. S-51]|uniref:diguanylate cyclase n=1 Tax=Rhizobium terricola TaxID=2728849 RepID=A0A7Y0AWA6_9HYPH|nr:GGDEF domain-containing protein [Rhizobium terricola]NML74658.1 GGDEF domain-containing protein [Rhizobium terricola]